MLIRRRLEHDGNFLFRWRSYLPLLLFPILIAGLPESVRVEQALGGRLSAVWTCVCVAIAFAGLAVRVMTIGFVPAGTSGRNTREQRADHLNTSGLYSVVRNPLYLGNFVVLLGVVCATRVWWPVVIATLAYWLYIERIVAAEEAFLEQKYGEQYLAWAATTPAFVPRWKNWRSPAMPFSVRTVLRREYSGLAAVGALFWILSAARDVVVERKSAVIWMHDDAAVIALFLATLLMYAALRSAKKHSRLLHELGR